MCHPLSWGKQSLLVFFHVYGNFFENRLDLSTWSAFSRSPNQSLAASSQLQCSLVHPRPLPTEPWTSGQLAQGMSRWISLSGPALALLCLPALSAFRAAGCWRKVMFTLHLLTCLTPVAAPGRASGHMGQAGSPGGHHTRSQSMVSLHSLPLILEEGMAGRGSGDCQAFFLTSF